MGSRGGRRGGGGGGGSPHPPGPLTPSLVPRAAPGTDTPTSPTPEPNQPRLGPQVARRRRQPPVLPLQPPQFGRRLVDAAQTVQAVRPGQAGAAEFPAVDRRQRIGKPFGVVQQPGPGGQGVGVAGAQFQDWMGQWWWVETGLAGPAACARAIGRPPRAPGPAPRPSNAALPPSHAHPHHTPASPSCWPRPAARPAGARTPRRPPRRLDHPTPWRGVGGSGTAGAGVGLGWGGGAPTWAPRVCNGPLARSRLLLCSSPPPPPPPPTTTLSEFALPSAPPIPSPSHRLLSPRSPTTSKSSLPLNPLARRSGAKPV